ncbi:hypothetical protein EGH21_04130 [Halomicroarcula sp. F13]|uniref:DUF7124 domain-containing protein n=1 Tax=Haloarcula rubra TaxID=2487747 RepID=A0AAW4PMG2_9EURY|nr:hypothetical protein [Halomicroarcula rubra]MBX0322218.1 hypothetical protein [Halomicroarcula rubra]
MTDEIDLDELDVESHDEDGPNRGDWFWRGEGDPSEEPDAGPVETPSAVTPDAGESAADGAGATADGADGDTDTADASAGPVPHVPRENKDRPAGIPVESGGAGGGAAADAGTPDDAPEHPDAADEQAASGPHGGGIDDMTMALTYAAAQRLADPQLAIRDAKTWTDWLGIVGDVETFVISKFQRDHGVDVDFFSGSGQSPGERLADIDEHSMFYAERMVVVGLDDEEAIADEADWEFVPLSTAAEKADWDVTDDPE